LRASSVDSYYQEAGRAGRDGQPAQAILFYDPSDVGLQRYFASGRVKPEEVQSVLEAVEARGSTSIAELLMATELSRSKVTRILNDLEDVARVRLGAGGRVRLASRRDAGKTVEVVAEAEENNAELQRSRVEMMRAYAETRDCRRRYLLSYYGEQIEPCCNCGNCDAGLPDALEDEADVAEHLVHERWGEGEVVRREGSKAVVYFREVGYKTIDVEVAREQRVMEEES
jgi:ATP-dependent DNA helicase RecQ